MTTVAISEFRANMSAILKKVQNGEVISLTQRGSEIARLVPPAYAQLTALKLREELRKSAIVGDLLSPVDVEWDAINDNDV